ncbi:hypothetical protein LSAT2_010591 [Lamellibrachia satsuma]|nr:hypothetical protein LSAT2_010591 [Lamellibrachia satsuma]
MARATRAICEEWLAVLKGYVIESWPLAVVVLVFLGYGARVCTFWMSEDIPPFNTTLFCCEREVDRCCVNVRCCDTGFSSQLLPSSVANTRIQSYVDMMLKVEIQSFVDMLPRIELQPYVDMMPNGGMQSYIDMLPKLEMPSYVDMLPGGVIQSHIDMIRTDGIQSYVDMLRTDGIQSYVDMLRTDGIQSYVDMLPNTLSKTQLLLLVYFVTTSLITAVVLVVKRVRVVKRDAAALRRVDTWRIESFEDKFDMRPKTFVQRVMRRNLKMKRQVIKNRKMLKQFNEAAHRVKEKYKGLHVILQQKSELLMKMEEKEQELSDINDDLKKKLNVLEGKMIIAGLQPEPDAPRPPLHRSVNACASHRDACRVDSKVRPHNSKRSKALPRPHLPKH